LSAVESLWVLWSCYAGVLHGGWDEGTLVWATVGMYLERRDLGRELRLDEDHQGVGQHAVIRHRLGGRLGLHPGHEGVHVGNVH
jgi:hypothetical protein